jgi:hypothetical protein
MNKKILVALLGIALSTQAIAQEQVVKRPSITGKNVLALSPLQLTERGVGIGLSYERMIDKDGMISIYLPFVYTFNDERDYNGFPTDKYSVQFLPGIKIYPTGYKGIVRYSVGPSLYFAYGEESYTNFPNSYYYYPQTSQFPAPYRVREDQVTIGMLVNNTLNINPTPHLALGLELGLGVSYLNRRDGRSDGTIPLAQFGFKVGYRF